MDALAYEQNNDKDEAYCITGQSRVGCPFDSHVEKAYVNEIHQQVHAVGNSIDDRRPGRQTAGRKELNKAQSDCKQGRGE